MKEARNTMVHYLEVLYTDESVKEEGWLFSANKELLRRILDKYKDFYKPLSPVREGNLSSAGEKKLEKIDLNITVVYCEDIKEYIL